jgi:hypothetical protein
LSLFPRTAAAKVKLSSSAEWKDATTQIEVFGAVGKSTAKTHLASEKATL